MAGRRSFAEVILSSGVNPKIEYSTLWLLFNLAATDSDGLNARYYTDYDEFLCPEQLKSFRAVLEDVFLGFPVEFRKTYRSLHIFDVANEFYFENDVNSDVDLNTLLTYIEYTLSLITIANREELLGKRYCDAIIKFNDHCQILAERLGHQIVFKDGYAFLVPKSMPVIEVARLMPEDLSYKTMMYNHRTMTGELEQKRETLRVLYHQLEPRRQDLSKGLDGVISGLVNNFNIRHNNIDQADDKNFKESVANLSKEDTEKIYDDIYELLLLAFMELDAKSIIERCKQSLTELKKS